MEKRKGMGQEGTEKWLVVLLILMAIGSIGYVVVTQTFWMYDIEKYWKHMSAVLSGDMQSVYLVMPWAQITGQLLCPGFLPYQAALVYFFLIFLAAAVFLIRLIYKYCEEKEIFGGKVARILAVGSVSLLPFYWHDALNTGNIGGPICILIMISAFLVDDHPYLAAVLLSYGMMKPQNAGIFLAILFFRKNYKTVFTTAGICVGGWGLALLYEYFVSVQQGSGEQGGGLLYIIQRYASLGATDDDYSFFCYGIFNPLRNFGVSTTAVLIISALFGIGLAFLTCRWLKRYPVLRQDAVMYYAVAGVLSVIWCYKSPCDEIIMIISSLAVLYYWGISEKKISDIAIVVGLLAAFNYKIFRFWGAHLLGLEHDTSIFGDQVLRLIAMIVLLVLITKKQKQENFHENPEITV